MITEQLFIECHQKSSLLDLKSKTQIHEVEMEGLNRFDILEKGWAFCDTLNKSSKKGIFFSITIRKNTMNIFAEII